MLAQQRWMVVTHCLVIPLHWLKIEIQLLVFCQVSLFTTKKAIWMVPMRPNSMKVWFCCCQRYRLLSSSRHVLLTPFKANDGSHKFPCPSFGPFIVASEAARHESLPSRCSPSVPFLSLICISFSTSLRLFLLP